MKLRDLLEVNFQNVDVYEPSGASSPVPLPKKGKEDRSRSLRRHWIIRRDLRKPNLGKGTIKTDNEDLTGSGANSSVNGPYK